MPPAISGSVIALGAPQFFKDAGNNNIRGAVVVLEGSGSYRNQEVTEYNTQSVTVYTNVTQSGGPVPFRFASKGAFNLRKQSANSAYRTFIGEQKT